MELAVNASILNERPTGLGIYTLNVIQNIRKHRENKYKVYTPAPQLIPCDGDCIEVESISRYLQFRNSKLTGITRLLWTELILPFKVKRADILYSTTHHGIIWGNSSQVITIHDLLPLKFPKQHRLQFFYFKYILPFLIKKASAIITVSNNTASDLTTYFNVHDDKVHVAYNGIDHNTYEPINSHQVQRVKAQHNILRDYFLIVGASYPHKNVSRVINAFKRINGLLPQTELVIVGGRREYVNELIRETQEIGVDRVRFLDYVPSDQLPALYSGAIALVYPSLYEGFGLPPLEAMACGCPAMVSRSSSLPEVCSSAALYFDPLNVDSIADSMVKVYNDLDLRAVLTERGLVHSRRFSWDQTESTINTVLQSVYEYKKYGKKTSMYKAKD